MTMIVRAGRLAAVAVLALAAFWPAPPARAQAQPSVLEQLAEKARRLGSTRVILELQVGAAPTTAQQRKDAIRAAQQRALDALASPAVSGVLQYENVPFLAAQVDEAALRAAAAHSSVLAVHEDVLHFPALLDSGPLVGSTANPRCTNPNGSCGAHGMGYTGAGQHVAILDTGVDRNHPFLAGKVVYEACFSTSGGGATSACPNGQISQTGTGAAAPCLPGTSTCLHGTHVAGIAAGNGLNASPAQLFDGIARDANIIAMQVFTVFTSQADCGSTPAPCVGAYNSNLIQALDHLYSLRATYAISSANMSLGGGLFSSACDSNPLKPSIDLLRGAGIATVIASGNNGSAGSISQPGCISSAVSVGSTTKQDVVSSFSNSASMLNLLAPGSSINSSVYSPVQQGQYAFLSGTSMATPHVTGAFAVLKHKSPAATVDQILSALSSTGLPVADSRNGIVKPRIRLVEALNSLAPAGPVLGVTPPDGLFASGPVGGPFTPVSRTYTLTNTGVGPLALGFSLTVPWATLDVANAGPLASGASTTATLSINSGANSLGVGVVGSAVNFTNATNGIGNTSRAISLTVNPPAPANDKFQDGIVLAAASGNTIGTSVGATKDAGEPNHAGQPGGKSVWWRWTAPSAGQLTIDTFGSGFDTVLAAYTGSSVSALTAVASNDNASGLQSQISFPVAAGTTYHIAVDGVAPAAGTIALNWIFGDLVQPGDITVTPETGFSSSGTAGSGLFTPSSMFYTLTNVSSGTRSFAVTGLPAWLTAAPLSGSIPAGGSATVGLSINFLVASALAPGVYPGTAMFNSTARAVSLSVLAGGGTNNDLFANGTVLAGSSVTATGSNIGATSETGEPNHAPGVPAIASVWWRWTAPASGTVTVDTAGSGFDTVLGVYTGSAVNSLTPYGNNDDSGGTLQSRVTFAAVQGTEYRIAVDGFFGQTGAITLHIAAPTGGGAPPNDAFSAAAVLSGGAASASGSNAGATKEPGEPDHAANPGGASVWWKWTAPASALINIDTFGSAVDTLLAVYTGGTVSGLTQIAANDDYDFNNGVYQSKVSFQAQQGTTYFIAVDGYNANDGLGPDTGPLTLNLSGSVPSGTHTLLYFSQPGDWIGQGQTGSISGSQFITASGNFQSGVTVSVNDGLNNWSIDFGAGQNAQGTRPPLSVGAYENAVRFPFNNGLSPGVNMSGNGRGCNTLTGRFDVLDMAFGAGGQVLAFAANFVQHCEGGGPALFGQVRVNSIVPLNPDPTLPAPFGFTAVTGAPRSTLVASSPVALSGFGSAAISVSGGEYSIDGGPFTSTPGTVSGGQTVAVRVMSSNLAGTSSYATVRVGAASATFQVTTGIGAGVNVLYFKSDPADYIGGGQERLLYSGTGFSIVPGSISNGVQFSLNGAGQFWTLDLTAPGPAAAALVPGAYENATRWPFQAGGVPGLSFSGDGRGCNTLTGRFDVLEAGYGAGGAVNAFAANFEQHCEGGASALRGRIRYNSSLPLFDSAARGRDYNGDGRADIFWKHLTTGQTVQWQMAGTSIAFTGSPTTISGPGPDNWKMVGTGDFNGDGKADLLWWHQVSGIVVVWLMDGAVIASSGSPTTISDTQWQVQGVGDFNGDGKADVLWKHTETGQVVVWLMNGASIASASSPATVGDKHWQVAGVGDFDGDGKADVLWQHREVNSAGGNGTTVVWLMNGTSIASAGSPNTVADLNWRVQGVADFDGNGKADVLWKNTATGTAVVWLMNGMGIANTGVPSTVADLNWKVKGVGDYDGDGKADIFWQTDAGGATIVWLMNGTSISSIGSPGTVANSSWQVQNPK